MILILYPSTAILLSNIRINALPAKARTPCIVFVRSNGVHTDLILPVNEGKIDWLKHFSIKDFEGADSNHRYIGFGWGNKDFYINTKEWKDLKLSTALKAAFYSGPSAMHVGYIKNEPKESDKCVKLLLREDQYLLLCKNILASFELKNRRPILIDHPGYGQKDRFYESKGHYGLFHTCNVWTGNCLKYSGVKIGVWTPFEKNVLNSIKN